MESRITTDDAKSVLRVMLSNIAARIVVGTITALDEIDAPLTENQKVEIVASAMMDYHTAVDEGEISVDMQLAVYEIQTAVNRVTRAVEWATREEAHDYPSWEL